MSNKYTYSISNDFLNSAVDPIALTSQVQASNITRVLDYINTDSDDCDIWFLDAITSGDTSTLSGVVAAHDGNSLSVTVAPTMADGRPIIRSESRPLLHETMFTMAGDTVSGIGDGKEIYWDFTNNDDLVASGIAPDGYKRKCIKVTFIDPVYIKESTNYFFGALKRSYIDFSVICPNGQYYYDRSNTSVLATEDTRVIHYVNSHFFTDTCAMGDELNTESCAENPLPNDHELWVEITVPEADNSSYGYGELEIFRTRTILLPGENP